MLGTALHTRMERLFRSGFTALDNAPPLKRLLTRRFMGIDGRLPRPARGLPF